MQRTISVFYVALFTLLGFAGDMSLAEASMRTKHSVAFEQRLFWEDGQFARQFEHGQAGIVVSSDIVFRAKNRKLRATFSPYLRLDERDGQRSYLDLREASVSYRYQNWDFLAGIGQIFWGVNESRNPVDIINQFDVIEDVDEQEKLGQPMLRASYRDTWGTLEAYYLPIFRERRFASQQGRLRFPFDIDGSRTRYQRGGGQYAGDIAVRYTKRFGGIDLGFHGFQGTSRNPYFEFDAQGVAIPVYQALRQVGMDVQYTRGPWLFKAEVVSAEINQHFWSIVGGIEYTFFDVKSSGMDVGVIAEYLFDNRDQTTEPINLLDDDYFIGSRLTFNDIQDTECLLGVIIDSDTQAIQGSVEFQRRIGSQYLLEIESRWFTGSGDSLVQAFANDDLMQVRFTAYF